MTFDDLLRSLVAPEASDGATRWTRVRGTVRVVTAATVGSPATVDVDVAGGRVEGLRYPKGSNPVDGDACWVSLRGSEAVYVDTVLA